MKKTKLLIPALSVASVGAVVAPMVTSCTSTYMTITDTAFEGEKHEEVVTANAWNQAKATTEYFKDKKYVVEDFATYAVQSYKEIAEKKYSTRLENAKVESLLVKFNNLTIGAERVYNGDLGYVVSGSFEYVIQCSYDIKPEATETTIEKTHVVQDRTINVSFKDCFAAIRYTDETGGSHKDFHNWALRITGYDSISYNWLMETNVQFKSTETITYKNTSTKININNKTDESTYSSLRGNNGHDLFNDTDLDSSRHFIPSNYLSKVAHA